MTRTKHTTRQTILDNNVSNARERLAKIARNRTTVKENRSIRKTRFLLKETKRKARRFKSENTNFSLYVSSNLSINQMCSYRTSWNQKISKICWFSDVKTTHETIDERTDSWIQKWYKISSRSSECFARNSRSYAD